MKICEIFKSNLYETGLLKDFCFILLFQVMQQRQVAGVWNAKDELPIEIDVGPNARYHSIFACPILKQQPPSIYA